MNLLEQELRKRTVNLFNDKWYEETSKALVGLKGNTKGYVYFIKTNRIDNIKIGYSINLESRLKQFKTGFSDGLKLIGFIYTDDFVSIEKQLHNKFIKERVSGEWFAISEETCLDEINNNNGVYVNGFYNKDSYILDGLYGNFSKTNKNPVDEYYYEMYNEFEKIPLNQKILKTDFYKTCWDISKKYKNVGKNKLTFVLKRWCDANAIKIHQQHSNGVAYFVLSEI